MNGNEVLCCLLPALILLYVMRNQRGRPTPVSRRREAIPFSVRDYVLRRDYNRCVYCGGRGVLHLDHVVPHSRGGPDSPSNLVAACVGCNKFKGARTPEEAGMTLYSEDWRTSF